MSAHRHGNRLDLLAAAEQAGVDLVEVDVHVFHGRLEARHEKTVGPVPIVFERRWQMPRWNPRRLRFDDVLAHAAAHTVLHVDLKGWTPRLSHRVLAALADREDYVVSARVWWLLRPFRGRANVRVMHSIGAPWQLRWFRRRRHLRGLDGVSIRSDLLTPEIAAELKQRATLLFVWRVTSVSQAEELAQWGVDAVVVDSLDLASALLPGSHPTAP